MDLVDGVSGANSDEVGGVDFRWRKGKVKKVCALQDDRRRLALP